MAQGNSYPFNAWVAPWSGGTTVGTIVDLGAVTSITNAGFPSPWQSSQRYDWSTGVDLIGGGTYVIFVGFAGGGGFDGVWRQSSDTYTDGVGVATGTGAGTIPVNGDSWGSSSTGEDLAFQAQFTTLSNVPEPATVVFLATGFLGIGAVYGKRRMAG
jgi:hypothetical protein